MNFFKKIVSYSGILLALCALFFAVNPFQVEAACEVNVDTTKFRTANHPNGGDLGGDWFDEENLAIVYLDFKTIGCQNSDTLYLTIFGIPPTTALGSVQGTILHTSFQINVGQFANLPNPSEATIALLPGENTCFDGNDDSSIGNGRECLVFAMFTSAPVTNPDAEILSMAGRLIGNIPDNQGTYFASQYAPGTDPTPDCNPSNQYLFRVENFCSLANLGFVSGMFGSQSGVNQKLVNFFNQFTNYDYALATEDQTSSTLAFPAITYDCDWVCEISQPTWQLVPNGTLPYGETSIYDTAPSTASDLPDTYQTEYVPLAPLPFEGLNGGATPSLGSYLAAIFRVAIIVAIILAVLMIVFHGIAYATTGAIQNKSDHKSGVWNAIMGLLLALGSWLLLNTISPRLASELSIGIPEVSLDGDAESISTAPITDSGGTITAFQLPNNMNLYCPGSGGSSEIPQIIDSFSEKVTYRWGGKGGNLPSGGQFKLSPNEQNNGAYMCTDSSGQNVPCRNFCPDNSVCLDCSGFVNHVRQCAGLSIYAGTSSMIQNGDAIQIDMDTLSSNGQSITVNGSEYTFQSGDILVWNGHVVVYYGDGIIAESKGDLPSIKNPNQNIKKTSLAQSNYRNKITHLIKVNP